MNARWTPDNLRDLNLLLRSTRIPRGIISLTGQERMPTMGHPSSVGRGIGRNGESARGARFALRPALRPCLRRALPCALLLACAALLPGAAGTLSASPAGPADRSASERPADAASLAESGSADRREAALQQGLAAFPAPVDEARASDPGGAGIHSARERETFWAWDFHHRHDYSVPARLRHASRR